MVERKRISIHALREEGDVLVAGQRIAHLDISTHALREEGDLFQAFPAFQFRISTHALREEGDSPQCRRPAMA